MSDRYSKRVKLTADLSSYDSRLTGGQLGWTERDGMWGVMVRYDCGAYLDTLWKSLEVQDEDTRNHEKTFAVMELQAAAEELQKKHGMTPAEIRKLIVRVPGLKRQLKTVTPAHS